MNVFSLLGKPFSWFWHRSIKVKVVILVLLGFGAWLIIPRFFGKSNQPPQYQTETTTRGTLIVSVSASGTVAATNNGQITTQASGVVKNVYVHDGDLVTAGDKIAEIDLDLVGKQKTDQALASYQSAKNSLEAAKSKQLALQAAMFGKWDTFKELAETSTYTNGDKTYNYNNRALPEFHIPEKEWLAAEADYKNQQNVIAQTQTSVNAAWFSYQQSSPIIYAPIPGTVSGLSLQKGTVITNTSSSDTATTGQKIANVITTGLPTISINLTQIDIAKVAIGDRATITLDSMEGKTFTGKIMSIDTVGSVSSGVTNYPAIIVLDSSAQGLYPNMSASANVITDTKDNVILVPSSAVQTQNGTSTVRLMQNNQVVSKEVEVGLSSDAQTEIISGISEGDVVITSVVSQTTPTTQTGTTSPFSAFGGGTFRGGGGGNVRIAR